MPCMNLSEVCERERRLMELHVLICHGLFGLWALIGLLTYTTGRTTTECLFFWHNISTNKNSFPSIFPHFSGELKKKGICLSILLFPFCCCCLNIDASPSPNWLFLLLLVYEVCVCWGEIYAQTNETYFWARLYTYFINKSSSIHPSTPETHCKFVLARTPCVDRFVSTPHLQCRLCLRKFEWIYFKSVLWSSLAFANSFCWEKKFSKK